MDYPKNFRELVSNFSTQEECINYLADVRWPNGFICPKCAGNKFWKSKRLLWICDKCEHHASVLVGTLFQDTKLPLNIWFQLIWWFMGQKSGASALSLQRNFGVGSYRTAWSLLQKLRSCMAQSGKLLLSGDVEVDEAFLGGTNNKEVIGIAAEVRGKGTGRIRLRHLKSRSSVDIHGLISDYISTGSKIISDRHKSYPTIVDKGYEHEAMRKAFFWEELDRDHDRLLPRVHRVASLLKRWYYGTYHGRIEPEMLQMYLDEFVFRFNRRTSGSRGLVFHRLIESAVFPST